MQLLPKFSDSNIYGPSKSQNFDFLVFLFFKKFLAILENYPPNYEILGSIEFTV